MLVINWGYQSTKFEICQAEFTTYQTDNSFHISIVENVSMLHVPYSIKAKKNMHYYSSILAWYSVWQSLEITVQERHFNICHDGETESTISRAFKTGTELHVKQEHTLSRQEINLVPGRSLVHMKSLPVIIKTDFVSNYTSILLLCLLTEVFLLIDPQFIHTDQLTLI